MSWDRSRKTPWKTLNGVEDQILNNRRQDEAWGDDSSADNTNNDMTSSSSTSGDSKSQVVAPLQFEFPSLGRSLLFGGCVGALSGSAFGFMDSMKTVQESASLKSLSNSQKGKYIFNGITRNGMLFGGFFGGYHGLKYVIRTGFGNPGDWAEIITAGTISLGAVAYKPNTRVALPYAFMLLGLDTFNLMARDGPDLNQNGRTAAVAPK